jgi:hypothetical protein
MILGIRQVTHLFIMTHPQLCLVLMLTQTLLNKYTSQSLNRTLQLIRFMRQATNSGLFVQYSCSLPFLHTCHHVTFKACGILLFCFRTIFIALKLIHLDDDMPITLNTVIKQLDLQDCFTILPVCSKCHHLFAPSIPTSSVCPSCNNPLFNLATQSLFQKVLNRTLPNPPPILAVGVTPLSSLLVDFLAEPGNEAAVDMWRDSPPSRPGELKRVMYGRVWNEIRDCNGKLFFGKDSLTEEREIRIGVNISLDWFVFICLWYSSLLTNCDRFQATKSAYSASHSSGVVSFTIQNLPPALKCVCLINVSFHL